MKYFLYRMDSDDQAPNGGDFMEWLYFYKWGRSEPVTFRKRGSRFEGATKGDLMFFVLDNLFIGDALIAAVRDGVYIEGVAGPVQEIDVHGGGIDEYVRSFGILDRLKDWMILRGSKDELRDGIPVFRRFHGLRSDGSFRLEADKSRAAVYDPIKDPLFFAIKKSNNFLLDK